MTNKEFKLPEKDKNVAKIESLKKRQKEVRSKLLTSKEKLSELNDVEGLVEDELSKNKKIAQALGDNNSNIKKSEKNNDLLNDKKEKLEIEIETLLNDLDKIGKAIFKLKRKYEIIYFVDLQQLLWTLHQDSLKNGTDHDDLINEIKEILYKQHPYHKFMALLGFNKTSEGVMKKIRKVKEVSG